MARNIMRDENWEETKKCMIGDEVLRYFRIVKLGHGLFDSVFH